MTKIYDQHAAAFSQVSAFVVMKEGERVATIAFKFPKDGAGRLWCYVHWLGLEMQRGYAGGYGYDKRTAAVCDAISKITMQPIDASFAGKPWYELDREMKAKESQQFKDSVSNIGGQDWDSALRAAGYIVVQAV